MLIALSHLLQVLDNKSNINCLSIMSLSATIGFLEEDFNEDLFKIVVENISKKKAQYISHEELPFPKLTTFSDVFTKSSASTKSTESKEEVASKRVVGFRRFTLRYRENGIVDNINIVFKIKARGIETAMAMSDIWLKRGGQLIDNSLVEAINNPVKCSELTEIACYNADHPTWKAIRPETFITMLDTERDVYLIAMEDLKTASVKHLIGPNSDVNAWFWREEDLVVALQEIARFHAMYYGSTDALPDKIKQALDKAGNLTPYNDINVRPVYRTVFEHYAACDNFNESMCADMKIIVKKSLENMDAVYDILNRSPVALIHNELSSPNVCLRLTPKIDQSPLCIYDWDLIRLMPPQFDTVYFIASLVSANSIEKWNDYLEIYRLGLLNQLEKIGAAGDIIGSVSDRSRFKAICDMCAVDILWNRLAMYSFYHDYFPKDLTKIFNGNLSVYIKHFSRDYDFLKPTCNL